MKCIFWEQDIVYSGRELRPHWIAEKTGYYGDAIVAFIGPCQVATSELVDLEDKTAGAIIRARSMLHFLAEFFHQDLDLAIRDHRLCIAAFLEELCAAVSRESASGFIRRGNDIYWQTREGPPRKLSVGIVTASPVSTLFHFGVNVDASEAPVAAIGLGEWGIDAKALCEKVFARWDAEFASLQKARCKVAPR